jgi:hypothetical protein
MYLCLGLGLDGRRFAFIGRAYPAEHFNHRQVVYRFVYRFMGIFLHKGFQRVEQGYLLGRVLVRFL